MSYIIKNSTQGAIAARLTDAGRKKLSEGKLNIGLFQIGDSEVNYDCYTQQPGASDGLFILQAEHNAQNLNPLPEKNKGHIKYPLTGGMSSGDTFGPTIPQHQHNDIYNTAASRGFFTGTTDNTTAGGGSYSYFSANVDSSYTLSSNWLFCASAITGSSQMVLLTASSMCSPQLYSPVVGDLLSVTYEFSGANCSQLNYSAASTTLFYQVESGNNNSLQTNPYLSLTVDRALPNFSGLTAQMKDVCMRVRVYPASSANPMTTSSIYNTANTITCWCDETLSFNNCCDVSNSDVKIWNMNINWTHQVAGVWSPSAGVDESFNNYGSSGYCGSKEYFGLESNNGQSFTNQVNDVYHPSVIGGTFYFDSFDNIRVVLPEEQKMAGFIHYTNNSTTDFYGEKFAMKDSTFTGIGEAKNLKLHLPWLMWHKKNVSGSGDGTGAGNENILGQTFYVDPQAYPDVFPINPHLMLSSMNTNMNDDGLRYYHLWDDNIGNGSTPNRVGKVFPDYKMIVIDDEELLTAMSYKANRSWTLPAPKTQKFPSGTGCPTGCTTGVIQTPGTTLWMTYMFENKVVGNAGVTTGLHCNYFVSENLQPGEGRFDVGFTLGPEFPYLRSDFALVGTGWEADTLYILTQKVPNGQKPAPQGWNLKDVTSEIPNHTVGTKISAVNIINHTFYLTANDLDPGCIHYTTPVPYYLNNFIDIPTSTQPSNLQFGDEYFFYGSLETDIMATIYEMKHVIQLGAGQYITSTNPTWVDYTTIAGYTNPRITEIGLYDNENGFPDLMAIAKLQSPVQRTSTQQFTISIDF
tara:strand:+ start:3104 stop:5512 length:2409 start_codon:yes stop_codon:yes gene_type:complete